jgi:ABC-type multidrug transport system fused ATPase/permease subunit
MVIRHIRLPFASSVAASVMLLLTVQFNVQVLANLISVLGAAHPDGAAARRDVALFVVSSILAIGLTVCSRLLVTWSDTAMVARLQEMLHGKLLTLTPERRGQFDPRTANILLLQTAPIVQPVLRDVIATPIIGGIALLSAIIFLFHNLDAILQAPLLLDGALCVLLLLLPLGALLFFRHLKAAYDRYGRNLGALGQEVANSAANAGEIAILGAQPQRSRRVAARLQAVTAGRLTAALRLEAARQFQTSLPIAVQAGFLIYATYLLLEAQGANLGGILAIYYFAPAAVRPMQTVLEVYFQVTTNAGLISQVGELLDAPPEPLVPVATDRPHRAAEVMLAEMCFAFGPQALLLDNLSHAFPAGSATAVIGRSGSGKSTLLSLMAGLRAPTTGAVLVDGQVPQISRQSARGAIALVSQIPLIIADTVRENFRLACDDAEDGAIEAVCREIGLWPILESLSPGAPLDAVLSPNPGQSLSGGARRLLAVARVLLLRPRVLLLDEPTTGVDALSLEALTVCLQRVAREATVIIAEHNLDFIWRMAGTVCCLEGGRFTDIGAASDLAVRPGLFRTMVRSRATLLAVDGMSIESVPLPSLGGEGAST